MIDLILLLIPFFTMAILSPRVVEFCRNQKMVAAVNERSAHKTPTPQGGGILLVAGVVPVAIALAWGFDLPDKIFLTALFLMSIPIAYVGWMDDKKHVNPLVRLAVHLSCVGVGLYFLPPLFDFVPVWLEKSILLLAWAWFVNLYNFMDGLDGLNVSEAVFLAVAVALLVPSLKPVAVMLVKLPVCILTVPPLKLGALSVPWM